MVGSKLFYGEQNKNGWLNQKTKRKYFSWLKNFMATKNKNGWLKVGCSSRRWKSISWLKDFMAKKIVFLVAPEFYGEKKKKLA